MKKTSIFLTIGIGIIFIATVLLISLNQTGYFFFQKGVELPQENIEEKAEKEVTLVIDSGKESSRTLKVDFEEGMTAFDLLEEGTSELGLSLKTKTYEDMGIFIEAIGDEENGQDGKYWMYYANGQMPMVAADKYEIRPGDKIEFKFEESPF